MRDVTRTWLRMGLAAVLLALVPLDPSTPPAKKTGRRRGVLVASWVVLVTSGIAAAYFAHLLSSSAPPRISEEEAISVRIFGEVDAVTRKVNAVGSDMLVFEPASSASTWSVVARSGQLRTGYTKCWNQVSTSDGDLLILTYSRNSETAHCGGEVHIAVDVQQHDLFDGTWTIRYRSVDVSFLADGPNPALTVGGRAKASYDFSPEAAPGVFLSRYRIDAQGVMTSDYLGSTSSCNYTGTGTWRCGSDSPTVWEHFPQAFVDNVPFEASNRRDVALVFLGIAAGAFFSSVFALLNQPDETSPRPRP